VYVCAGEREDAAVSRDLVAAERNAGFIGDAVREIQVPPLPFSN
jgi:hypothetical protein